MITALMWEMCKFFQQQQNDCLVGCPGYDRFICSMKDWRQNNKETHPSNIVQLQAMSKIHL